MTWKRLGRGLLFGLAGFLLSTGPSSVLVLQLYTRHDRELAAAMGSFFFFFGFIGGAIAPVRWREALSPLRMLWSRSVQAS
jgi:hypothetical protein